MWVNARPRAGALSPSNSLPEDLRNRHAAREAVGALVASSVSLGPVLDSDNANGPRADPSEEDPIVRDPEPQFFARRTQSFHVAGAGRQVIVNRV